MRVFREETLTFATQEERAAYHNTLRARMDRDLKTTISIITSADGLTLEAKYIITE